MSKRPESVAAEECAALGGNQREVVPYPSRETTLGALDISRALPIKGRRLVGPWCFLDRFGPLTFAEGKPMDVAPHPHIGLQTVSWLLEGEVVHDDSLGYQSLLRPGGVNVMTSGAGIAHSEQTPQHSTGRLNGVQLWTALPDRHRQVAPGFTHVAEVPVVDWPSGSAQVFCGELAGATSPAPRYSELVGADVRVRPQQAVVMPLNPAFEHAILVLGGDCALDGQPLQDRALYYLGTTRSEANLSTRQGGRLLLIGGPPFPETILMWWNFVARTPEEIAQAHGDWKERRRFGEVRAYEGARLEAPSLMRLARPNPVS